MLKLIHFLVQSLRFSIIHLQINSIVAAMKRTLLVLLVFGFVCLSQAQPRVTPLGSKKYPSLFWEITGNGLVRPSYLFGTMHVSSKMVFHLPDSFYLGIKSVDVVALETNPESWQEDLVKYDVDGNSYGRFRSPWNNLKQIPDDYLNIRTLQFPRYEKQIEAALYSRPSTINNLLYRNYSDYTSDFEENTYLDMYIYQVGKKMGKRVAGVERYDESMRLMMEAYRDAAKDKMHKDRSFDRDENYSADKLQEAYRSGNLDLLDSINRLNSFSDAFDEKFLYRRNYLQANSIDSILKTNSSLFVGVGAAHLPGNRGVIEILRRKGYLLRPIVMGERDGKEKEIVEKLRVPVAFVTQMSDDGFFKVDIPGKFYRFTEEGLLDQMQYADMANGSYYMVTRIKTQSAFWGHGVDVIKKKIDSLLYENVPGNILSRHEIERNGYAGLDIVNRTRRGDVQRYNIFITPYEVIIFKMSGNGDYIKDSEESKKFFGSIQLKEYQKEENTTRWSNFQPPWGGFSVKFPHEPFLSNDKNWLYQSQDKVTGSDFSVIRVDIHNYGFVEEDSFDLDLLEESFSNSEFITKQIARRFTTWQGYPALEAKYQHADGSVFITRYVIQGPHYYVLIAHGRKENTAMQTFLNSFELKPFNYSEPFLKRDSSLCYSVKTAFYPDQKKIKLTIPGENASSIYPGDDDDAYDDEVNRGTFKNSIIENDSTGEKIYISFYKAGRYYYNDDSSGLNENRLVKNASWIIRKKKQRRQNEWNLTEFELSDTNSSRLVWTKSFYKPGIGFFLATEGDTLTAASSFVTNFFETFKPADTLTGFNPFIKKSAFFFSDFFSRDSGRHKRAVKAIDQLRVDSTDFSNLKKAIIATTWSERSYIQLKKSLIGKLGDIKTPASAAYLKQLYYSAADTIELQYAILESLLQQQTQYAFSLFKDIILQEPPVIEAPTSNTYGNFNLNRFRLNANRRLLGRVDYDNGDFWDELYDSLRLTRSILPEMLPLLNLDDYKSRMMKLLAQMIDSNLVKAQDYEPYYTKFFIEAKQEFRKQVIKEKRKLIEIAKDEEDRDDNQKDNLGNEKLSLYAKLLLPFWKLKAGVPEFFQQLLQSNDTRLKYNTLVLLIQDHRPVPDSLLNYFASIDDYRYTLYSDLARAGALKYFPARYNNHVDLARSKLIESKTYGRPDSLLYIDKLSAEIRNKRGYIYFFKYKEKKDDLSWKLAATGLISKDPKQFDIDAAPFSGGDLLSSGNWAYKNPLDFTSFTNTKLDYGKSIHEQLSQALRKMLYSRRASAKEFYSESKSDFPDINFKFRD